MQADSGLVLQPNFTLFANCPLTDRVVVRPYVSLFNSSSFDAADPMPVMMDVMVGAAFTAGGFIVDGRYAFYEPAPAMRLASHELGLKASYDLLSLWPEPEGPRRFGMRVSTGFYGGLSQTPGVGGLYVEPGIEPSCRFELAGKDVGVSFPVLVGVSADNYYVNGNGGNAAVGYLSSSVTGSMSLPAVFGRGRWFLNSSFQYLHLFADDLIALNRGRSNAFIGKVGVGFVY